MYLHMYDTKKNKFTEIFTSYSDDDLLWFETLMEMGSSVEVSAVSFFSSSK